MAHVQINTHHLPNPGTLFCFASQPEWGVYCMGPGINYHAATILLLASGSCCIETQQCAATVWRGWGVGGSHLINEAEPIVDLDSSLCCIVVRLPKPVVASRSAHRLQQPKS